MSFEIQNLPDILKIVILIDLKKGREAEKSSLKKRIDKFLGCYSCIEAADFEETLQEMVDEGLIISQGQKVRLTDQGIKLSKIWHNLLFKREPILEVVAGLTDGSITGLIIILSAFFAGLTISMTLFATILTLAAVSITNFSSFMLGGKTEDAADILSMKTLIEHSLSDIADKKERDKSLTLIKHLFVILGKEITRSNFYAAAICGTTTFLSGSIPIIAYLMLPKPIDIILSLAIVGIIIGIFLVRYRSKKTKVHWQIILIETLGIVVVAVLASLLIGGSI